ncbi:AbrB/MazE/SpoVT family DNA-binding domain-containing protein [Sphingomonas sp.]|jgi:antitoxin MazE|uniref:AbrB/MazE/SpoVT family DNA-binding domain-containing protein n=1 Tax=Sphingomonas sp. TaxID=28214 RepID=UPI002ED92BDE
MQSALRKMGNSVGLIVPKALLQELGAGAGTAMDVRVEDGRVVATPMRRVRAGWAEGAAAVAAAEEDVDEAAWSTFGNDGDDELIW